MQRCGLVLGQVLSIVAALWAGVAFAGQPIPSEIAEGGIGNYGFSFRVLFWTSDVGFNRTSYELPRRGTRVMPAYAGASHPIFRIALGRLGTNRVEGHRGAWDHQVARYKGAVEGTARAVSSRLSPAVLIDCPWPEITVRGGIDGGAAPALVAFVQGGKVVVHRVAELAKLGAADLDLDEPWLLGWFGQATPHRGYLEVMDLDPEHDGAGFATE